MTTTYAPAPDVLAAHLRGEAVLLHVTEKRYFRLNESAACVWRALESGAQVDAMVRALEETFEVSADTARNAVETILADLEQVHLVTSSTA
jgi:hypothetical protein